jgi:asparagine synthase (glutamine-hydrolysing)
MCGLAGIVGHPDPMRSADHVRAMLVCMQRRGPDGEGLHSWPGAVLGHRRLAIYDLSDAGRQPMLTDDGEVGVVFNGAI